MSQEVVELLRQMQAEMKEMKTQLTRQSNEIVDMKTQMEDHKNEMRSEFHTEILEITTHVSTQASAAQHHMREQNEDMKVELKELKERLSALCESRHATEDLAWLVASSTSSDLSAEELAKLKAKLECGAEVCRHPCPSLSEGSPERVGCPVLHTLVWRGCVAGVEAVMAHPTPVYLTAVDGAGCTPLHVLCDERVEVGAATRMLQAMVARAVDPLMRTEFDLSQRETTRGLDFVSAAAASGRLSVFWPHVRHFNYYADEPYGGIALRVPVRAADWAQLSAEDRRAFIAPEQQREAATAALKQLCSPEYIGDASAVSARLPAIRDAVAKGSDVNVLVECGGYTLPLLSAALCCNHPDVVEVLLTSPLPIDFTLPCSDGYTPLHYISLNVVKSLADVSRLLQTVVQRLGTHPEDKVDWRKKDYWGNDAISNAASYGVLSAWVEVLYVRRDPPVPYFTEHDGKMPITGTVDRSDWNRVPEALRERFNLQDGINESE